MRIVIKKMSKDKFIELIYLMTDDYIPIKAKVCTNNSDSVLILEKFGRDFLKPYCFKNNLIIENRIEKIKIWEK